MNSSIILNSEEIKKANRFAQEVYQRNAHTLFDFANKSVGKRNETDFIADTAEGKLAEIVLSRFFSENAMYKIDLDFKIYDGTTRIDFGQDIDTIQISGINYRLRCRIDMKATRAYSKWLLVESHKYWADAYILVKMNLPKDLEKDLTGLKAENISGEVTGFAYYFDLIDPTTKDPWFRFPNGSTLYNPAKLPKRRKMEVITPNDLQNHIRCKELDTPKIGFPLKAELNYGLPSTWLRKSTTEWKSFFEWILASVIDPNDQLALNMFPLETSKSKGR